MADADEEVDVVNVVDEEVDVADEVVVVDTVVVADVADVVVAVVETEPVVMDPVVLEMTVAVLVDEVVPDTSGKAEYSCSLFPAPHISPLVVPGHAKLQSAWVGTGVDAAAKELPQ